MVLNGQKWEVPIINEMNVNMINVVAEYVWLDRMNKYRSKSRTFNFANIVNILDKNIYPVWNYDGSSTGDIIPSNNNNNNTECQLQPIHVYNNPFRNSYIREHKYVVVWCNNFIRYDDNTIEYIHPEYMDLIKKESYISQQYEPMFGFEQEFFVIDNYTRWPVGFKPYNQYNPFAYLFAYLYHNITGNAVWNDECLWDFKTNKYMYSVNGGQGPYYCGNALCGQFRDYINNTYDKLLAMGLKVTGMNYEVAPGQAEFQICDYGINACDGLHMLRWVLTRNAEQFNYTISFDPVVIPGGKYNNTGCHTNFSTNKMRGSDGMSYILNFIDKLGSIYNAPGSLNKNFFESIFGKNNCQRLTGDKETSPWNMFTYGIGTRHTSVRIPNDVKLQGCGYFEDRRPGGNVSPYTIANNYYNLLMSIHNIQTEKTN